MRKLNVALAPAAVVAMAGSAQAIPAFNGLRAAADHLAAVEQAQFVYGGREYCFYLDGWHGPGWYWCGYRWRRDLDVDRTVGADGNGGSTEERSGGSTGGVSLNDMNGGKNARSVVTEPSGEKQKSPRELRNIRG
jgi:hypothetical protein